LSRLREQRHVQSMERLDSLQNLLGTGWWEISAEEQITLAPTLASALNLSDRLLPVEDWLSLFHPADRDELRSRLRALQWQGEALT
ncbi:PAS domain-containing protein, partial [Psychrobacter sp. TB20-MNA-CIBAN-0197]